MKIKTIITGMIIYSYTIIAQPQSETIINHVKSKNWSLANEELKDYKKKYPEKKWAWSTHSWVLENLEKYDDAILNCESGLKKWPTESSLKNSLARVLTKKAKTTDTKTAHKLLLRASELVSKDYILYQLAKSYRNIGDFDKAAELMLEGSKMYPDYRYFEQSLSYTRYLGFKKVLKTKNKKNIKKQIKKAVGWLNPEKPMYKQIQYLYILRFGMREINDPVYFEKIYSDLIKRFINDPYIYDEYGFQLYANHRLHNPFDPEVKKKAIRFRKKAYHIYWKKFKKPLPISDLGFPLKGSNAIWSSFGGSAMTHNGMANYCYDFAAVDKNGNIKKPGSDGKSLSQYYMFGSPVYAVKSGIVDSKIDEYPDNQPGAFSAQANTITIDHEAYQSFYAHMKSGSILVKKGQKVKAGQLIGYAGNSGMSSEPHLHFCIYNKNPSRASIPFYFRKTRIKKPDGTILQSAKPYEEKDIVNF